MNLAMMWGLKNLKLSADKNGTKNYFKIHLKHETTLFLKIPWKRSLEISRKQKVRNFLSWKFLKEVFPKTVLQNCVDLEYYDPLLPASQW